MNKKILSFLALVASDFVAVFLSFVLALLIRIEILPLIDRSLVERAVLWRNYLSHAFLLVVWFLVFLYEKLYSQRFSFLDEVRILLKSTTISFVFIMVMIFISRQQVVFSRLVIVLAWVFSLVLFPLFRFTAKRLLIHLKLWNKKAIILCSQSGESFLLEALDENPTLGYEIVGCLAPQERGDGEERLFDITATDKSDSLEGWQQALGFDDVIINLPNLESDRLTSLLKKCEPLAQTIRYIPTTGALITAGVEIENIGKILCLAVRKNLAKPWNIFIKNIFEYVLAVMLFVLMFPFLLLIAVAVKVDSRGPVFYIQERYARKGKRIKLIKFRSMHLDAEKRLSEYFAENPGSEEEWLKYRKIKGSDPRVTRLGRLIRKYSLDELPQLLNVFKGEMSLVGPRPYLAEELDKSASFRPMLFQVKPGITGLWQISGRSLLPFRERLNLDEYYIRNWSLWLDIVILLKTLKTAASGRGAF
jgi:Undecaprenyl-phosphate galactose phosphotransferase WbaP